MTTPTSHGSLPTQWLETHSGTGASGVVSVSQGETLSHPKVGYLSMDLGPIWGMRSYAQLRLSGLPRFRHRQGDAGRFQHRRGAGAQAPAFQAQILSTSTLSGGRFEADSQLAGFAATGPQHFDS